LGQPVFDTLFVGHPGIEHCRVDNEPVDGLAIVRPVRPCALDPKNRQPRSFIEPWKKQLEMLQIWLALWIRNEPDIDVPLPWLRAISDAEVEAIGLRRICIPRPGIVAEEYGTNVMMNYELSSCVGHLRDWEFGADDCEVEISTNHDSEC
jgi:hypothetical protein